MTRRVGYLAIIWAGSYGILALVWTLTGSGFPFGHNNPNGDVNLLRNLSPNLGAPVFAVVLLATAVAAMAMTGRHAERLRGAPRIALLTFSWLVVAGLLLAVPDVSLLAIAGYAPMLIIGAPFGWPPIDYSEVFTWSLLNQAWCVLGGLLLARAILTWQFATRAACVACGRGDTASKWATAESAKRWGKWAAYIAAAIPVFYAVSRLAWYVGIPFGVSEEFLRDLKDSGGTIAGAGLGTFAVVGGILTLGLVQRWGEVFPRWMIGLAGRRVPIKLAVVPATLVAVAVTTASVSLLTNGNMLEAVDGGMATMPMTLWPLWGVALGAATLAYYLRRRGLCATCDSNA